MNSEVDTQVAAEVMGAPAINSQHKVSELPQGIAFLSIGDQSLVIKVPSDPFAYAHWSPSSDIAAAFEVVAEMQRREWHFALSGTPDEWCAIFGSGMYNGASWQEQYFKVAQTPAEAICRAALAAVRAKVAA